MEEIIRQYNVTLLPWPLSGCRGYTQKKKEGYVVLIAEHLSESRKNLTIWHELLHIVLGHFDDRNYLSTEDKEKEVSSLLKFLGG